MTNTFPDYDSLRNNYLNMLASNAQSNVLSPDAHHPPLPLLTDSQLIDHVLQTSPLFSDLGDDFQQQLTPLDTPLFEFEETSPFTSPLDDFLTTPLFQDADEPGIIGEYDGMGLFDEEPQVKQPEPQQPNINLEELYTMSPTSPALDSIHPSPYLGVASPAFPSQATGTRKGTTLQNLIPLDAPTQPRNYRTPSATSRQQAPAAYTGRKRPRDDDDEDLGDLPVNATEEEMVAHKRRQNTIAARKSRRRKLEYTRTLEDKVEDLTLQVEQYKAKAEIYAGVLKNHGLVLPAMPP